MALKIQMKMKKKEGGGQKFSDAIAQGFVVNSEWWEQWKYYVLPTAKGLLK